MNLQNYVNKGVDFEVYNQQTLAMVDAGDKGEMQQYYDLNAKRMRRLYKTFKLTEEQKEKLRNLKKPFHVLVISEAWCGDAAQILPILDIMLQETKVGEAKIIYRDENLELMDTYHTYGSHSIPILIGVNAKGEDFFRFGPRPAFGMELLAKHKADPVAYPKSEFYPDLQKRYNADKGQKIFDELYSNFLKA